MGEWFSGLSGFEQGAFGVALLGTVFFAVKMGLQMAGIGGDVDMDDGGDVDMDADGGDGDMAGDQVPAVVTGLHLFSVHGVALGLGVGGWCAMALYASTSSGLIGSAGGLVIGVIAMYVHAKLMKGLLKLQEVPTVRLKDAVGKVGEVYLTVPKYGEGSGKVNIVLNEALKDYDAISRDDVPIPSGAKIRVMEIDENGMMVVQRVSEEEV